MRQVFLGPILHWLILISIIAGGWITGKLRLHVSEFNPFIVGLILVTVVVLLTVLRTSAKDTRVTRDPIIDSQDD